MEFSIPFNPSTFRTYYPDVTQTTVATTPKIKYAVTLQDPAGSLQGELDGWATRLKNENTNYGIVVFMGTSPWGVHTEIWTGNDFYQGWIKGKTAPFGWAPVWFWSMGLPTVPIV